MKEYEITGRLPSDDLDPDPKIIARYKGSNEVEAFKKFKKGFPNIPIIGWVMTKIVNYGK